MKANCTRCGIEMKATIFTFYLWKPHSMELPEINSKLETVEELKAELDRLNKWHVHKADPLIDLPRQMKVTKIERRMTQLQIANALWVGEYIIEQIVRWMV